MCLIVAHKPGAKAMPLVELQRAWNTNHDGAGYMYINKGKLKIRKPFFRLKDLTAAYYEDHERFGTHNPFVLHLRFATHGKCNMENTHPHAVADKHVGVAHNGILWAPKDQSDTVYFCKTVLAERTAHQLLTAQFRLFIEEVVGVSNKLVLLSRTGQLSIINEDQGEWIDNTWYSNVSFQHTNDRYNALMSWWLDNEERFPIAKRKDWCEDHEDLP